MNSSLKFALTGIFAILFVSLFAHAASAYYYDNDYKRQYSVKESSTRDGYTYTERSLNQDPWGKSTYSRTIQNYDTPRGSYRYYTVSNDASDYFEYGPAGYTEWKHLGYGWDDSWRRNVYDSQYHTYYYQPAWNGDYWDWQHSYSKPCSYRC